MDKYIRQSIDSRKNALSASYEINVEIQKKTNALFTEIEKLGAKCKDVGEFETEFAKSPLNQKYLDLFTKVATSCQAKVVAPKASKHEIDKMVASGLAEGIASRATEQVERTVLPTRAAIHQEAYDIARKAPVLGDAIDIGQKASYASHLVGLFRKKKKNK